MHRRSSARARWTTALVDGAVGAAEPWLDCVGRVPRQAGVTSAWRCCGCTRLAIGLDGRACDPPVFLYFLFSACVRFFRFLLRLRLTTRHCCP
jgi:hypothetical protein